MTLFNMWLKVKEALNNKKGQGMVEYVLIIAFIAVVVIIALTPLGTAISAKFTEIVTALTGN